MPGVGMDLLEIDRLERALARRPGLARRLFTSGELAEAERRARPPIHLAARFCAKEAVVKALELDSWSWHEIEVVGGGRSAPRVRLSGQAAARAQALAVGVTVSLTHSHTMAGAVAITTADGPPGPPGA